MARTTAGIDGSQRCRAASTEPAAVGLGGGQLVRGLTRDQIVDHRPHEHAVATAPPAPQRCELGRPSHTHMLRQHRLDLRFTKWPQSNVTGLPLVALRMLP